MIKKFLEKIKEHKKIILLRHIFPDFDAIGSQMGLYRFIKENFSNKIVLCGGELPIEYECIGKNDKLQENDFQDALVIITDTAITSRIDISNIEWLKKASCVFKIDHHINVEKYGNYEIVNSSCPATCELLTDIFSQTDLIFSKETAFNLYHGLVTDTDRFMYRNVTERTFRMASILMSKNIDLNLIYKNIYGLDGNEIKLKAYILQNYKMSENKIAYIELTKEILSDYNISDVNKIALWVNMLGEINSAKVWIFFVENKDYVRVEFRSDSINVSKVAKHFGGGGHKTASGAKVQDMQTCKKIVKYLNSKLSNI
ncbi:DHH family phosphoesterase [Spiroplasma floricola]|uniref:Bifunctional oligoribonuclease and PAP phosphatase NrnA n=1 Tax=Spiroplasma floricola 23-6 TaxID=1336749 RepID=A0A2K8SFA7_9MOLU|nr:bifunctional oligoribonuclease/PAP phosphatase NrnA [Spiroplasma floricola]AUB31928.1 bifunctional oligoribonuclease and PAP phosphatase NrnA [Spiroplasma floricola 23-6]